MGPVQLDIAYRFERSISVDMLRVALGNPPAPNDTEFYRHPVFLRIHSTSDLLKTLQVMLLSVRNITAASNHHKDFARTVLLYRYSSTVHPQNPPNLSPPQNDKAPARFRTRALSHDTPTSGQPRFHSQLPQLPPQRLPRLPLSVHQHHLPRPPPHPPHKVHQIPAAVGGRSRSLPGIRRDGSVAFAPFHALPTVARALRNCRYVSTIALVPLPHPPSYLDRNQLNCYDSNTNSMH